MPSHRPSHRLCVRCRGPLSFALAVVVNRDGQLDACAHQISNIIDAEKCRVARLGM